MWHVLCYSVVCVLSENVHLLMRVYESERDLHGMRSEDGCVPDCILQQGPLPMEPFCQP